jgi:hypothetical protein
MLWYFCADIEFLCVEIVIMSAEDLNIHEKYVKTAES